MNKRISFLLLLILALSNSCTKKADVVPNVDYAIGTVFSYTRATGGPRIVFDVVYGKRSFRAGYQDGDNGWKVPDSYYISSGDKNMVQLDKDNPQFVRMLFSYPVYDSAYFKADTALFAKNLPQ